VTRSVRAKALRSGDVLAFYDTRRRRETRRTVERLVPSDEWPGEVEVHFRRWRWALHLLPNSTMRVRRYQEKR